MSDNRECIFLHKDSETMEYNCLGGNKIISACSEGGVCFKRMHLLKKARDFYPLVYDSIVLEEIPEEQRLNKFDIIDNEWYRVLILEEAKILMGSNGLFVRLDVKKYIKKDGNFVSVKKGGKNFSILTSSATLLKGILEIGKRYDTLKGKKLMFRRIKESGKKMFEVVYVNEFR